MAFQRGFHIHLKNFRYIPPYPLATPPELEGWLSLLRERMLMAARTTLHNPRLQQSRSNVLPLTHSPSMVGNVSRLAVGWLF